MVGARKSPLKNLLIVLLLTAALVPALAGSAGAVDFLPLTCTAGGTVVTTGGTPDTWNILGAGSCQGDLEGTYIVQFSGVGTSTGLGLCSPEPLPFVVTDLNIVVTGVLTSLAQGTSVPFVQRWTTPLTTYPLGTPFLVTTGGGDLIGAGAFFNHIFLNCSGSPAAQFTWAFFK